MSLEVKIMDAIKTAMKEKNSVALDALRAVKSQLLLLKTSGKDEVSQNDEITLLQRLIKQRKESAQMFETSGRTELADNEINQIKYIEQFLPTQLSVEELTVEIQNIINELGVSQANEIGKVMGVASKKFAGTADGKTISEIAKKLLS
jgi:uncharacterized protein YqeY